MSKRITSTEIRKLVKAGNFVVGTELTLKNLKLDRVEKVILSSNCPGKVADSIGYYAGLSKADVLDAPYQNEELGVMCKKPFSISVLSILKGAK